MLSLESKAPSVYHEFMAGNFVVKRSDNHFSQIPTDQATEWMNKICKMNNGIIGITRNDQARDKFCITWGTRSNVSQTIRSLLGDIDEELEHTFTRHDCLPSRVALDEQHVQALMEQLDNYDIFCRSGLNIEDLPEDQVIEFEKPICDSPQLVSLATKDVASAEIVKDLMEAKTKSVEAIVQNVQERLILKKTGFFQPMKKKNSKTFAGIYQVSVGSKQKTQVIKADRKLLQRLLTAAHGGRSIEIGSIMRHELSPVPLSLAKVGGTMNTTTKSDLMNVFTSDMNVGVPEVLPDSKLRTCAIIDGHAMIQALGKPAGCVTFGDYADIFLNSVLRNFDETSTRVDVVFDRYLGRTSIKTSTRGKRIGKRRPIRKLVSGPEVPLPQVWEQFIAMDENKADLAHILSEVLTTKSLELPQHLELVTSGGFKDVLKATSNRREVPQLSSNHEEADTRLVLHALDAKEAGYQCIVVKCRDTDVFLLLVHHVVGLGLEVWMLSGTAKKMKCFPAHVIAKQLPQSVKANILGFHAVTGCDTTSAFSGIGKKTCWKVFMKYSHLLVGIGRDGDFEDAEKFVCILYGISEEAAVGIDDARRSLFVKAKRALEMLPPTRDALELHVSRANYQAKVWINADKAIMDLDNNKPADTTGWQEGPNGLEIVWKRLPAVPEACLELISCGCKKKCVYQFDANVSSLVLDVRQLVLVTLLIVPIL